MLNLLTSFWDPDWSQFWPSIIATLIGFSAPFVIQGVINRISDKIEAKDIATKLHNELKIISTKLNKITEERGLNNNPSYLNPIATPIYKGLINSTKISLLNRYVWYDMLLTIYDRLELYNDWHNFLTNNEDTNLNVGAYLKAIEDDLLIGESTIKTDYEPIRIQEENILVCGLCKDCQKNTSHGALVCLIKQLELTTGKGLNSKIFLKKSKLLRKIISSRINRRKEK